MRWDEQIAGELPAPRQDEPESLRQDIADELADHLQSALTRELHFTRDETTARQNVISRFGDVRKVARRLWFDAMQEKIMSQRLTLLTCAVMAAACLAACGLMWTMLGRTEQIITETSAAYNELVTSSKQSNADLLAESRRVNEKLVAQSKAANDSLIEQSRKSNQALLEKLEEVSAAAAPKSLEWNGVKVRVVGDREDGPRLKGIVALLYRRNESDPPQTVSVRRTTDDDGLIDFGLQRTGNYSLYLWTPWKEMREMQITVKPGQELLTTVVAPASAPDDLRDRGLWAIADLKQEFRSFEGWREEPTVWSGTSWRSNFGPSGRPGMFSRRGGGRGVEITTRIMVNAEGKVAENKGSFRGYETGTGGFTGGRPEISFRVGGSSRSRGPRSPAEDAAATKFETMTFMLGEEDGEFKPQLAGTALKYELVNLAVALPPQPAKDQPDSTSIEMLGAHFYDGGDYYGRSGGDLSFAQAFALRGGSREEVERQIEERRQRAEELRRTREFTPQAGVDNVWTIELPDELLELVRGNLKQMDERDGS